MSLRPVGSTSNLATIRIFDDGGIPAPGLALHSNGAAINYKRQGSAAVAITITGSPTPNYTDVGDGSYEIAVPDAAYASANPRLTIEGSLAGHVIIPDVQQVGAPAVTTVANSDKAGYSLTTGERGSIADAVWDEDNRDHLSAHSTGKNLDTIRKKNLLVEGTVLASPTPTTTVFNVSGVDYPTGAFKHSVLSFAEDATIANQNSPILTYVNNGNGTSTITIEEPLTSAPTAGDKVQIDPNSHVHAISAIVSGVWSAASSAYSAATGTMGLVMYAFSQMLENVSGWRWKEKALEESPTAAVGDGIYAITLVAASSGGNVPGTTFSIVGTVTNVTTNSGGTAVLNLNAGTYTLRTTTPPGYQSVADSSLVVSADATVTKTLVATSYTPTTAPGCTVTIPVRSQYTTALAGVDVKIKFIGWETGATKPATILSPPPIQTSDANGLVSVILYRQARYTATYTVEGDTTKVVAFTTPNAGSYVVIEG
jgi:hypothetical protein